MVEALTGESQCGGSGLNVDNLFRRRFPLRTCGSAGLLREIMGIFDPETDLTLWFAQTHLW